MRKLILLIVITGCSVSPPSVVVSEQSLPPDPSCAAGDFVLSDEPVSTVNGVRQLTGNRACFTTQFGFNPIDLKTVPHPSGGTWFGRVRAYETGFAAGSFANGVDMAVDNCRGFYPHVIADASDCERAAAAVWAKNAPPCNSSCGVVTIADVELDCGSCGARGQCIDHACTYACARRCPPGTACDTSQGICVSF